MDDFDKVDDDYEFIMPGQSIEEPAAPSAPSINDIIKLQEDTAKTQAELNKKLLEQVASVKQPIYTQPLNAPNPQVDLEKEFEQRFFKEGQSYKVFNEAVARSVAPIVDVFVEQAKAQNKKLLEVNPETRDGYLQYKDEIEQFISQLPDNYKKNATVYDYAYDEVVKKRHGQELQNKKIQDEVEKRVQEELKKMGIQSQQSAPKTFIEGSVGMQSPGGIPNGTSKKRVQLTQAQIDDANRKGIELADYVKYYLN